MSAYCFGGLDFMMLSNTADKNCRLTQFSEKVLFRVNWGQRKVWQVEGGLFRGSIAGLPSELNSRVPIHSNFN